MGAAPRRSIAEPAAGHERTARISRIALDGFCAGVLGVFVVVGVFPFLWMLRTAVTPAADAFSLTPSLVPTRLTADHLIRVVSAPNVPFVRYFLNTSLVAFATTAMVVVLGTWGAYALARLEFRGKRAFGLSLLVIQMFPGVLMVIPLFVVFTRLGLVDNFLGLVIAYTTGSLPFVVWLLRGYFLSIPRELEDAARIDGATYLGTLFRIVIPLAAPGLAAVATLAFVHAWNEFFFAYVLISDDQKKVLAIGLASYVDQFSTDYGGLFAMASLTTLPVVAVFMIFQRYLVGGLTTGSVKG
jgi:arabinogalactan oligomer/maltooligosaccharide transport system permease protein